MQPPSKFYLHFSNLEHFMAILRNDVAKVALLARLELSDVELDDMTRDLQGIVGFISSLDELDTSGVEPLAHPLGTQNVFREDILTDSLSLSEALQSAPRHDGKHFLVPAVLGETGSA